MKNQQESQKIYELFMEQYEEYNDDIFRFCMVKTRNRDQALDVTQESFMKLWEYVQKQSDIGNYRALLYRIAHNLIIDGYRKKKSQSIENYDVFQSHDDMQENPRKRLENQADKDYALNLLNQLPEPAREIVSLKILKDLSVTEIGEILGYDPKTISVYLHRALKKLRALAEEQNSS